MRQSDQQSIPNKPHHVKGGFQNSVANSAPNFLSYLQQLVKHYTDFKTAFKPPAEEVDLAGLKRNSTQNSITWLGHATCLIKCAGITILTDPQFSPRASLLQWVGPRRLIDPPAYIPMLPPVDYVVISHNHYDHLDKDSILLLREYHPKCYYMVPRGVKKWMLRHNIELAIERDWWESFTYRDIKFTAVPAQHCSGRGLFDHNNTLWAGWVIENQGKKIYFAGDTGYHYEQFRNLGRKFGTFDLACLPIGAYSPAQLLNSIHMNPEQAATAHKEINSVLSIPIHWGTFRMSLEPMDEPSARLQTVLQEQGIRPDSFPILSIGQTVMF